MTTAQMDLTDTVEKEVLSMLSYPAHDVLATAAERVMRQHDAQRATALGNNYQG